MTVRVTVLKGLTAGAYYVEHLPGYYLAAGEPRGRWLGDGAVRLGLAGEVGADAFLAVIAGREPAQADRHLGRAFEDTSVRGFDATASAPKSVSVLFALGDERVRQEVSAAHDAAVEAMVGWVERHAHTRFRIAGQVAVVDAEGLVVATFRQHTSRALDPQLHTHVVIANRVLAPDGRWLALDARSLVRDQRTLSAVYHAGLRAELTARLGARWLQPVRGIAEIADVPPAVLAEFSARTTAMRTRLDVKLERFVASVGRDPTVRERWRLEREAAVDSRPVKAHVTDAGELHEDWRRRAVGLGVDVHRMVAGAIGHGDLERRPDRRWELEVTAAALGELAGKQSTWRPAEIVRELAAATPTDTTSSAMTLLDALEQLADRVVVDECVELSAPVPAGAVLRRDGRPLTESALDRALTTRAILAQEEAVIAWAGRCHLVPGGGNPAAPARSEVALDAGQAATAAGVAGDQTLVLVVGPAGAGKTKALAAAVAQLRAEGRPVFGVTPSAAAAAVLASETGVGADTLDKLLVEHSLSRPPDDRYRLPAGATVIVDEAGMLSTDRLAELAALAERRQWRVALVGDPLQFSAVGRGGLFGILADTFGAVELQEIHRFAADWERQASLRLRRGDVGVIDVYQDHGRLHDGSLARMERDIIDAWRTDRAVGHRVLLMAPTNETVTRLNAAAQQARLEAGELSPDRSTRLTANLTVHVGDEIATRQNSRELRTDRGEMIRNRATWTVTDVHPDGGLTVTGRDGTVRLPSDYGREHVELAYAATGHGAQGRTVDTAHFLLDSPVDTRGLYVPMTRGVHSNDVYVAVTGERGGGDVLAECLSRDWIDRPAIERRAELQPSLPPPRLLDPGELRALIERRHGIEVSLRRGEHELDEARRDWAETGAALAHAERQLEEFPDGRRYALETIAAYDRPKIRQHHIVDLHYARYHLDAINRSETAVRASLPRLAAAAEAARDHLEAVQGATAGARGPLEVERQGIGHQLGDDQTARAQLSRDHPAVIEVLGDRPASGRAAAEWDRAAGLVAQHQVAYGFRSGLGRQPDWRDESAQAANRRLIDKRLDGLDRELGRRSRSVGIDFGV